MKTLHELLDSPEYDTYRAKTLLNPQYHILNNTDVDVDAMLEAQQHGDFGVSHGDCIECMRDFVQVAINDGLLAGNVAETIEAEIDALGQWHEDNMSITGMI